MEKTFCIAGPVKIELHYALPFRMNEADLMRLIDDQKYFILHAPRQSGKTTAMKMLVDKLNASGSYEALYVNVEPGQAAREDYASGLRMILKELEAAARKTCGSQHPVQQFFTAAKLQQVPSGTEVASFLRYWTEVAAKPTIFFIDEIDSLVGDTLISVLRQLRAGYVDRPDWFPQSVCLIGVRDVRDYQIYSSNDKQLILGGSAFNIKAESLTIENFSAAEVRALYLQHTAATGQQFTDEAIAYGFEQTHGQPWLVNALAYQACFRDVVDRSQPITLEVMERSRETLVLR
ncbi:AAA family ATPase, partial [Candidatus Dependentiae bacterium]|nr:AAA family ATPase [Candidatus Dependentiae bacterium]